MSFTIMAKQKRSKNTYTAHRKNQREKILEVAESLFIEKGIEPVIIADIAAASRLTRATIYKYFSNRKEIAFEIFRTIISGWHERDKLEVWPYPGNGFQRVEKALTSFCAYMFGSPQETRFIAEFNYLYGKEWPSNQVINSLQQILGEDRNRILECVRQGIADGSLRPDLDPNLLMAALYNLNSSLLNRLGQMGVNLQEESRIDADKIISEIYRIFLNGIKANSNSRKNKSDAKLHKNTPRNARAGKSKRPGSAVFQE
jgi:AcrR family transcriptional regulator